MKILIVLAIVAIGVQFFAAPAVQFLADVVGGIGFVAWSWWEGLGGRE